MRHLVENIFPKYALIGSILRNLALIFLSPFAAYAKRCAGVWKFQKELTSRRRYRTKGALPEENWKGSWQWKMFCNCALSEPVREPVVFFGSVTGCDIC